MRGICEEIARRIGTTRSTTHRLASCLVDERYLRVVPQVGYLLGPKLIESGVPGPGRVAPGDAWRCRTWMSCRR